VLRWHIAKIAAVLGCRDFAGVASLTLASIYLQKAHSYSPKQAGFTIGAMMLISVIVNPLAVWYSPGARRLKFLATLLVAGGVVLATVPFWPVAMVLPVLCAFQSCQLGSYAVSDAAILERVAPDMRGRVVGLFLLLAGTFASTAPFLIGWWVDLLQSRSAVPAAYGPIFGVLAAMMVLSAYSIRLIIKLTPQPLPLQ
jgi:MFS family permease